MDRTNNDLRIAIAIHDLNTQGGQDRCTLEIAKHLSHLVPVDLLAYSFSDFNPGDWGTVSYHQIKPMVHKPLFIKDPIFQLQTSRAVRRLDPQTVVHGAGAATKTAQIIHVHFVQAAWHDPDSSWYHQLLQKYKTTVEKAFFRKDLYYIAISKNVKADLQHHLKIPAEQIRVISHGVNGSEFSPYQTSAEGPKTRHKIRNELNVATDDFHLLFVGALNERKGLSNLLKAMAKIKNNGNIKLSVVGSGPADRYKQLAVDLGVSDNVQFVGAKPAVTPYYWSADALISPTRYEPFGLAVFEAMACGLPVVVSGCAGVKDLLTHNKDVLLMSDKPEPDEIASTITRLASNREFSRELGAQGFATATKRPWSLVAKEYLEFTQQAFAQLQALK